jgi:hypothetical protein
MAIEDLIVRAKYFAHRVATDTFDESVLADGRRATHGRMGAGV